MKIIYHCYGGSHSSVTAASIHVGLLSNQYVPTVEQLRELPFYDKQVAKDHGILRFIGKDEFGNEIYLMGRRNISQAAETVLQGMAEVFGLSRGDLYFVDVMPHVNWMMMVGGYLSRRWGLITIGRPIVMYGTRRAFKNMVALVDQIKLTVARRPLKGNQI